jgi:hypothetical protein
MMLKLRLRINRFSSNIKDKKIKVLKSQLKKKSKPRKVKVANATLDAPQNSRGSKLNPNKNYLKDMPASDGMKKNKSHAVLSNFKANKKAVFGVKSDDSSGVSDVDEDEYYDVGASEISSHSRAPSVLLPSINGRSKKEVYQSLSDLHDVKDKDMELEGMDHASDFERYDI